MVLYFNPEKPCSLWVDARNFVFGGILLQPDKEGHPRPISYVSRSLTEAEFFYITEPPGTEKEILALIWIVEKTSYLFVSS